MAEHGESRFGEQVIWDGQPPIEMRFEVLHQPPHEMWEAMMKVNPGMAIAGEDKVLNELEALAAELTGKEAAMFLPTTTNGIVLTHMNRDLRGKQVIMEASCHIFWVEALHVSHLSGAMPRLIRGDKFGAMNPDEVEAVFSETAYGHTVPVGMIDLENTHNVYGGTVLTPEYTQQMAELAHRRGADLFLDGARVATAAVAQGVPIRALTEPADHVAISLSKDLGAPMGAVLCSSAEFIEGARNLAKRTGMIAIHKAGIFAAAGIIALTKMVDRLPEDHRRTRLLAEALSEIDGLSVDLETVQTNLCRVSTEQLGMPAIEVAKRVADYGLAVHVMEPNVFKLGICYAIDDAMVDKTIDIFKKVIPEIYVPQQPGIAS
jgi:threonine aldolase